MASSKDVAIDNAGDTQTKPTAIELVQKHTHAGRDLPVGTKLPLLPSDELLAIDAEAAAWLVSVNVAKWV